MHLMMCWWWADGKRRRKRRKAMCCSKREREIRGISIRTIARRARKALKWLNESTNPLHVLRVSWSCACCNSNVIVVLITVVVIVVVLESVVVESVGGLNRDKTRMRTPKTISEEDHDSDLRRCADHSVDRRGGSDAAAAVLK